jgi:hypothetical protein
MFRAYCSLIVIQLPGDGAVLMEVKRRSLDLIVRMDFNPVHRK